MAFRGQKLGIFQYTVKLIQKGPFATMQWGSSPRSTTNYITILPQNTIHR